MDDSSEDIEFGGRSLKFDSVGLGFSRRASQVFVHYPKRAPDGSTTYGAGVEMSYPFAAPDANAITRERVGIIESLGSGR